MEGVEYGNSKVRVIYS